MSAPVNTARVIKFVQNMEGVILNENLIKLASGSDEQWGRYLQGARAGAIVALCNQEMRETGKALSSEGVGSKEWRLVSVHEAHMRTAQFNLNRIDGAYRRIYDALDAIACDTRAPKKWQIDALAWLQLFNEPRTENGLKIMREFANDLLESTEKHQPLLLKSVSSA